MMRRPPLLLFSDLNPSWLAVFLIVGGALVVAAGLYMSATEKVPPGLGPLTGGPPGALRQQPILRWYGFAFVLYGIAAIGLAATVNRWFGVAAAMLSLFAAPVLLGVGAMHHGTHEVAARIPKGRYVVAGLAVAAFVLSATVTFLFTFGRGYP